MSFPSHLPVLLVAWKLLTTCRTLCQASAKCVSTMKEGPVGQRGCRRTTGGTSVGKDLQLSTRRQGDANDTIAAVFNMPGSRRLAPTLSGMSGISGNSNTFSERYCCPCRVIGQGAKRRHVMSMLLAGLMPLTQPCQLVTDLCMSAGSALTLGQVKRQALPAALGQLSSTCTAAVMQHMFTMLVGSVNCPCCSYIHPCMYTSLFLLVHLLTHVFIHSPACAVHSTSGSQLVAWVLHKLSSRQVCSGLFHL